MEPRDKRDLPEVVAEILIEQHAMREEIAAMRQEMREGNAALRQEIHDSNAALRLEIHDTNAALRQEIRDSNAALRLEIHDSNVTLGQILRDELQSSHAGLVQLFNGMTNSILDAMNRGNERYNNSDDRHNRTTQEVDELKTRVTKLENPAA